MPGHWEMRHTPLHGLHAAAKGEPCCPARDQGIIKQRRPNPAGWGQPRPAATGRHWQGPAVPRTPAAVIDRSAARTRVSCWNRSTASFRRSFVTCRGGERAGGKCGSSQPCHAGKLGAVPATNQLGCEAAHVAVRHHPCSSEEDTAHVRRCLTPPSMRMNGMDPSPACSSSSTAWWWANTSTFSPAGGA